MGAFFSQEAVVSHPITIQSATAETAAASAPKVASRRWRTEDWIAVVLGFLVIVSVLSVFQ
jgi:hypothetical protein